MSFGKWSRRLDVRWGLLFLAVYCTSLALLFSLLYFSFTHLLRQEDQEVVRVDFARYAVIYETQGLAGLEEEIRHLGTKDQAQLFIRWQSASGPSRLLQQPADYEEYQPALMERAARAATDSNPLTTQFNLESPRDPEDQIYVQQKHERDGSWLQVGRNSEDAEAFLGRLRKIFTAIALAGFAIGLAAALAFARQWLRPIRRLIQTLRELNENSGKTRLPEGSAPNELNELARMFNLVLEQNEKLVARLRDSLNFVAHDLRTPMARFRARAERALADGDPGGVREALNQALEDSAGLISLVQSLLEIGEAESGALPLDLREHSVASLLREVCELYEVVAEDRGITLYFECAEGLVVKADDRIKQVLANLLDNALKFSPSGSCVTLSGHLEKDVICLEVADQGEGISPEDQPRIWDRLYRGETSRTTKGLGLSLAKSLVIAHGGSVEVESATGEGARFRVRLPIEAQSGRTRPKL